MFLRAWDVQHPNTDGNLPVALHEGGLDLRPRPRGAATGAGRAHRAPTRRGLPVPAAIYTAGAGWGQTVRFFGWVWTHQCSVKALFPLYKQQLSKLHNDENRPLRTDSLAQKNACSAVLRREGTHRQYSQAASHTYRGRELWFEGWRARVRCPRLYSGASHRAADASSTLPRYLAAAAAATPLPL